MHGAGPAVRGAGRRAPKSTHSRAEPVVRIDLPPAESRANFRSVRLTRAEEHDLARGWDGNASSSACRHRGSSGPGSHRNLAGSIPEAPPTSPSKSQTTGTTPSGNENHGALLRDAELAIAAFVPADKQDAILMLLRLDRALLELFAVRGRNMTAYHTAKAKDGLS